MKIYRWTYDKRENKFEKESFTAEDRSFYYELLDTPISIAKEYLNTIILSTLEKRIIYTLDDDEEFVKQKFIENFKNKINVLNEELLDAENNMFDFKVAFRQYETDSYQNETTTDIEL